MVGGIGKGKSEEKNKSCFWYKQVLSIPHIYKNPPIATIWFMINH